MDGLLDALNHHDLSERLNAQASLARLGDAVVEPLIALLANASAPFDVRWRVALILGATGDSRALDPLIAALSDPSTEVRTCAVWALCELRQTGAFDALCGCVLNAFDDEQIPYMAALTLIACDVERAQTFLLDALRSDNDAVCRAAMSTLALLKYV